VTQLPGAGAQQQALASRDRPTTTSREFVYCFAFLVISTSSGGVILGVGSFADKFKSADLLPADDLNVVFNVGFQHGVHAAVVRLHDSLGPRAIATLGMALATVGNLIIGLGAHFEIRNVYMYALAYGLVGGGGNAPFIGGFHFASLFDAQGVRCAVLAAGFNIAGYFYRLLNVGPLSLEAFFYSAATFTVLLGIGISHVYPDTPYRRGDVTVLSLCPSSCNTAACMRAGVCGAGTVAEDRSAYAHGVITRAQGTG